MNASLTPLILIIIAPLAKTVHDTKGFSRDIHLRFLWQITVSIPDDLNWENTAITIDITLGLNFGIGFGKGYTIIKCP